MRIQTLVASACAAAMIPTLALGQQTCEQRQSARVAGTLVGAGIGAVAGSAIAGRGDRNKGTVLGGVAGALIGNQASKGQADCRRAYGFYDDQGAWHANTIPRADASGYFVRDGAWVEGAPRGHYGADGRWVQANTDASASGYYADNVWVPASANGYYTQDGRWITTSAGHYNASGQWIPGAATGRYDANGRWMTGQASGKRDARGAWVNDPQPGYYDKGRWVRGETVGYYDTRGQWISTDGRARSIDTRETTPRGWERGPSIDERQSQLAERINRGAQNGRLSRGEVTQARRTLVAIERQEQSLRTRRGYLGPKGQAIIAARLDELSARVRVDVRDIY